MDPDQGERMARYLLGQLPEQEQSDFESRYFADDNFFEELLTIEDDLRDAYVRGELSKADGEAFERRLLISSDQKHRQEFARTLCQYLNQSANQGRPISPLVVKWKSLLRKLGNQPRLVLTPVISVALVLLIVGGWWLGHRSSQAPSTGAVASQGSGVQVPQVPLGQQPETKIFAVVLTPGLVRGEEESKSIVIPPDVSKVRLEARFEGKYPRFQATLATVEGKELWSKGSLQAEAFQGGKRIFLEIPRSLLVSGDYILALRGWPASGSPETVAEYSFRVAAR
jgi:hypothetical protein